MTIAQAYNLTTSGGADDFSEVIALCEKIGPYCLIGGLALNTYVDPVYTLDADLVIAAAYLPQLKKELVDSHFEIEDHLYTLNAQKKGSDLRIQFSKMPEYFSFPQRATEKKIFGISVKIALIEDITHGKILAFLDPSRRLSKKKKDELDLIRIGEKFPHLIPTMPEIIRNQFS